MDQYAIIKIVLIVGFLAVALMLVRPIRSASHLALRRLGMMVFLAAALLAIIFPGLLARAADLLGVDRGLNLLVYMLVVAFFWQLSANYRRDCARERQYTLLVRALALRSVTPPATASTDAGPTAGGGSPPPDSPGAAGPVAPSSLPPEYTERNDFR